MVVDVERDGRIRKAEAAIRRSMKALGTWRPEFSGAVRVLAVTQTELDDLQQRFDDEGALPIVMRTMASGVQQPATNPLLSEIVKRRADVVTFSRELGLTPAGLKKLNDKISAVPKSGGLEDAMKGIMSQLGE